MVILRIILLLWLLPLTLGATNYYVKIGGSDAAAGTSDALAWATTTRVNTAWNVGTFAPGDSVLFRRGDTWYGTITVRESGTIGNYITIGAYGSGNKPIIEGFSTLNSWTQVGSTSVYYATSTFESAPSIMTIDGVVHERGRYPNTGWAIFDVINTVGTVPVGGSVTVTDNEMPASPDWDGAEMVIRFDRWTLLRSPITNHTGTSLTFTTPYSSKPIVGWGYFIQNSLSTLDSFGEWYYDQATARIYMHFGGGLPTSYTTRVSTLNYGVFNDVYQRSYISIDNIHFQGTINNTIHFYNNVSSINVSDCQISYSGANAIYMHGGAQSIVSGNTISYSNYNAINLLYPSYANINHNIISYTGVYPGNTSLVDANYFQGIICEHSVGNNIVEYNTITNTGYIGIRFGGTNTIVRNNLIDTYCFVKDDGAAIYTFNDRTTGKQVNSNIVMNGIGAIEGTPATTSSAHGLYTDGGSSGVSFRKNILIRPGSQGYHGNLPVNITLDSNIVFQSNQFMGLWKFGDAGWWNGTGIFITNLNVTNNVFISTLINPNLPNGIAYHNSTSEMNGASYIEEIGNFGTWNNNYYYSNQENIFYMQHNLLAANAPYNLERWTSVFGHDINSTYIQPEPAYTLNSLGSNLLSNGTFTSNISGWSASSVDLTAAWNATGIGNGGSLQITSTQNNLMWYWWSNSNAITSSIIGGVIDNTKHYILRILGRSAINNKTLSLRLASVGTGHEIQRFFTVDNVNTQQDVLLSNPEAVLSGATIRIAACDDPISTNLDNIELYEANITVHDANDYLHPIYNTTSASKTYFTSAPMTNYNGNIVNSITLDPWEGTVLIGNGTVSEIQPGVRFSKSPSGNFLKSIRGNFTKTGL